MQGTCATFRLAARAMAAVTALTLAAAGCSSGSANETDPTSIPGPTTTAVKVVPTTIGTTAEPAPTSPSAPVTAPGPNDTGDVQHGPIDPGMTRSGETVITAIPALIPTSP